MNRQLPPLVLRPIGLMVFSGHNANFVLAVVERFRFRFHTSLRKTSRSLKWAAVFQLHNPTLRFRLPLRVGIVSDGMHNFRSSTACYNRPDVQVEQLNQLGMADIVCAPNESAEYMPGNESKVAAIDNPWVCYMCRKPGAN